LAARDFSSSFWLLLLCIGFCCRCVSQYNTKQHTNTFQPSLNIISANQIIMIEYYVDISMCYCEIIMAMIVTVVATIDVSHGATEVAGLVGE
jgi:hypothetical protein